MPDLAIRRALVERRGIGCTRFVGPALIAEHTRAGNLGGAGDDRLLPGRRRRAAPERSAPARERHHQGGESGGRGGYKARPPPADPHVADVNIPGTFRPVGRHRESITTVCRTTPTSGRFEG